jgi:membrane-associated phospholipid phosphatase
MAPKTSLSSISGTSSPTETVPALVVLYAVFVQLALTTTTPTSSTAAAAATLPTQTRSKLDYVVRLLALGALVVAGKVIFQKPRPPNPFTTTHSDDSFPSGHAAFSAFIFFSEPSFLTLLFFLCVSLSRLSDRVHHLSDVLAGALLGACLALY